MKLIIITLGSILFLASCKKKYICECSTPHPQKGFINKTNYIVKEKNRTKGLANCNNQYNASGLATNGINCSIN